MSNIVLEQVKQGHKYQASSKPFISIKGGTPTIHINRTLSVEIGAVEGMNLGFYNSKNKFMWGIYVTSNVINSVPIRNGSRPNTLRVNSKKTALSLQESFKVKDKQTVRLFVGTKSPIRVINNGEEHLVYMIYDIPALRDDLSNEEQELYSREYLESYTSFKP